MPQRKHQRKRIAMPSKATNAIAAINAAFFNAGLSIFSSF
jgi:hypothetical protein